MAKKKKKINLQAQQKLQAAQHKKQYMTRYRRLCTMIGNGEPLFDILSPYILNIIYVNRGAAFKIKVKEEAKITKRFVKIMYCYIEKEMQEHFIDLMIPDSDYQVSLVDYYQIILPFESILRSDTCRFAGMEKFAAFSEKISDRRDRYCDELEFIISYACYFYSDLSKRNLYTYEYEIVRAEKHFGIYYQIITLGTHLLDIRYADIRGDRRPVIQTGEMSYKDGQTVFVPNTVTLRQLYIKDPSGNKSVPVYIQQHAIDRTIQRACCTASSGVLSLLANTFSDHQRKYAPDGPDGDRYLIACFFYDIKIGYFVGRLINGIFVILTFLFITQSKTPEGRKLAKITGLQRDDMTFLAIDDLKTLINSDINDDPRIKQIFIDAGCESILQMNYELHAKGYYKWLWDESKQDTEISKLIAEYLQLGDNDKEYFENEIDR
jgi:hypothetical protein